MGMEELPVLASNLEHIPEELPLGIGALHFGSLLDVEESRIVIHEALDHGIRFFDTSPLYGNGKSEEILGRLVPKIDNCCIATKVGLRSVTRGDGRFGVEPEKLNESSIFRSVDQSLEALKRESIGLLMLHAYDPSTPLSETLDVLEKLYYAGKVRSFGCSNYNPWQLKELIRELKQRPSLPFTHIQCHYNMIERRAERSLIGLSGQYGMRLIVNRALARGVLSDRYRLDKTVSSSSRGATSKRIQNWITEERRELIHKLSDLALQHQLTLSQVALTWILNRQPDALILIGARNREQLQQNLLASKHSLPEAVVLAVEKLTSDAIDVYQSPPRYFEK